MISRSAKKLTRLLLETQHISQEEYEKICICD